MSTQLSAPPIALKGLPRELNEHQLTLFKFYMDGLIQTGMQLNDELYRLVSAFGADAIVEANQLACQLRSQGIPAVVSRSNSRYVVWACLRSGQVEAGEPSVAQFGR